MAKFEAHKPGDRILARDANALQAEVMRQAKISGVGAEVRSGPSGIQIIVDQAGPLVVQLLETMQPNDNGKLTPKSVGLMWGAPSDTSASSVSGVELTFSSGTITRASGSWLDDGYAAGSGITVSGSSSNDGSYAVSDATETVLSVHDADAISAEVTSAATVTGTRPDYEWTGLSETMPESHIDLLGSVWLEGTRGLSLVDPSTGQRLFLGVVNEHFAILNETILSGETGEVTLCDYPSTGPEATDPAVVLEVHNPWSGDCIQGHYCEIKQHPQSGVWRISGVDPCDI